MYLYSYKHAFKTDSDDATAQPHSFASPEVMYTPRSHSPLLFHIEKYSRFVREIKIIVCFPQPCPSAGRRFAAIKITFEMTTKQLVCCYKTNSKECSVNWMSLNFTSVRIKPQHCFMKGFDSDHFYERDSTVITPVRKKKRKKGLS